MSREPEYEVAIVGGGHNGLTAAALLARAGHRVIVLERLDHTGGAAISTQPFAGVPARLSRYSYLVSLMPEQLMVDLDLNIQLASRTTASYTPWIRGGHHGEKCGGLLVERPEGEATRASFRELTGGDEAYAAWVAFYDHVGQLAEIIAPTLLDPLPRQHTLAAQVDGDIWRSFIEQPLGAVLDRTFDDDTVKGVVATDALIGTFASLHDTSLIQNRCFLYHLIGNGTGEWRVPVGGMGAVTDALLAAATRHGATIRTNATVTAITPAPDAVEVQFSQGGDQQVLTAAYVLSGVAPWVLDGLRGRAQGPKPEGAQLKINFLLDRLPRLRSGIDPAVAFAGTLHLNEDATQLETAYADAQRGMVPQQLPGEVYCHSLTDPSILGGGAGQHTLTYFGLHTPARLFDADPVGARERAVRQAIASLNQHLVDPIESCLARDAHGDPCIEAKIPHDIDADLAMPGGHIFHGDLAWPWAEDAEDLSSPQAQWGVATPDARVLMCGSGARRGGAVSGLGGHNAAQAVMSLL